MPSMVSMGADLTAPRLLAPRPYFLRRFAGFLPLTLPHESRLPFDKRTNSGAVRSPHGHAPTNQEGDESMKRIAFVITSLVLLPNSADADQQVRAAWYGNELRGHRTASGEMFNPDGLTAAHKSFPFGTCLVVGNPKTGKTVAVRVNDRGPFVSGLTLDLSSGAARAIGMRSTESVTMRRC
jgi:rare lipoprotein A